MSHPSGTCKYCGCTDDRACEDGCYWVDDKCTVCSNPICATAHGLRQWHAKVLLNLANIRGLLVFLHRGRPLYVGATEKLHPLRQTMGSGTFARLRSLALVEAQPHTSGHRFEISLFGRQVAKAIRRAEKRAAN